MTISSCLRRIAALKGTLSRLEGRLPGSVSYETSKPPAWTVPQIEANIASARAELMDLKEKLSVANATTSISVGIIPAESRTLISCIIELQELRGQISSDELLMGYAQPRADYTDRRQEYVDGRAAYVSVPMTCDLTEEVVDKRLDALRDRFSRINAAVEAANHTTQV
jgi:hypothetical protein